MKFHWYFYTIFTLFYVIRLRIWVLTFIHVPDDGSAEPKHVVYWHNLRVNDVVRKIYMYTVVCLTVFITTVHIQVVYMRGKLTVKGALKYFIKKGGSYLTKTILLQFDEEKSEAFE
jgi:hypothetical protein